jgi:hypothetical protein
MMTSRAGGFAAGAAGGAAAGFMTGAGPVGAGVGAVVGGFSGLYAANQNKKKQESPRLYDLLADPFETTDRAAKEPTVVAEYLAIAKADAALDLADMPDDLRDAPP